MEFLIEIQVDLPGQMPDEERVRLIDAERVRGRELAAQGVIRAIWRVPGRLANRAIWSAKDAGELHAAITSLPLWPYCSVNVMPLARHELADQCQGLPPGLEA